VLLKSFRGWLERVLILPRLRRQRKLQADIDCQPAVSVGYHFEASTGILPPRLPGPRD
jgi:hypothetical protein